MPPAVTSSIEPITGRTLRSLAFLGALIMAALIYLLLAIPGVHRISCPAECHEGLETAHLPRGTGDLDVAHSVLTTQSAPVAVEAAPPGASGPALVALVTALVAALLAFFPARATRAFYATIEAVLGVGRWYRTVVLHL